MPTHYPSWGSETQSQTIPRQRLLRSLLTTPHGDQKLLDATLAGAPPRRSHYPSWGSETTLAFRLTASLSGWTAHYPSWGSETSAASSSGPAVSRTHYPSWGSETMRAPRSAACESVSLPLMGIRNSDSANGLPAGAVPHYPSWGSETLRGGGDSPKNALLTTPHGDQKPSSPPDRRRWTRSHYPSWGSETLLAPVLEPDHRLGSLPLMGIRNQSLACSIDAAQRTHYPSWGSETLPVEIHGVRVYVDLTTPHGDQKLGEKRAAMSLASTHYPSWGSETHFLHRMRPPRRLSLPLMGIRNLFRCRCVHPHPPHLTTPHGDQKQTAERYLLYPFQSHYPSWGSETTTGYCC